MIERPEAARQESIVAPVVLFFILLMQTAALVGYSRLGIFAAAAWAVYDRWLPAIIGISGTPSACTPVMAGKPVPVMNEFLNFVTYDRDTTGRNGPRRAAKGIRSHVF
jgi:hypothetical protein